MITPLQRKALELFFKHIAEEYKELGWTFDYEILGIHFELPVTRTTVREYIWKPIQKALFDIESTSDLNSHMINVIIDVFVNHFGKQGIEIEFPSEESLMRHLEKLKQEQWKTETTGQWPQEHQQ